MRYLVQELGPEGFRSALADRVRFELAPRRGGPHPALPRRPRRRPRPARATACSTWAARCPSGACGASSWSSWPGWPSTYGDGTVRLGHRPELRPDRGARGPHRRPAGRGAPGEVLAVPGPLRARRDGLHRLGVLPLRHHRDQGARRQVGPLPRRPPGRGAGADQRVRRGPRRCPWPSAKRPGPGARSVPRRGRAASSACTSRAAPPRCAQPQIADIGLRGDVAHVGEHIEEAVDIGLGGSLGPDAAFIDWVDRRHAGRPRCPRPSSACSAATRASAGRTSRSTPGRAGSPNDGAAPSELAPGRP